MSELFSGRDIDRERSDVNAEIEQNKAGLVVAEETIRRLQAESVHLKRRLNKATSFINNLPEDILSELFLDLCNEPESHVVLQCYTGRLPRQFLLGSVCYHWREVAWRTPGLWRQVAINFREASFDVQVNLLQDWIKRSRDYPVQVVFFSEATGGWEPPSDAFEKILESCHRWETFSTMAFKSLASALEKGPTRQFSMLKSLELTSIVQSRGSQIIWKFYKPARLQRLSLSNHSNCTLDIDWAVLTSLTADFTFDASSIHPISVHTLSSCTSLTTLEFTLHETEEEHDGLVIAPGSIHLPNLKQMRLSLHHSSSMDPLLHILTLLTVPSLESLALSTLGDPSFGQDGEWLDPLVSLARRSSFKLSSLSLELYDQSDVHLRTLLRQLSPSNPIESLRIDSGMALGAFPLSNGLINQMIVKSEDSPQLQKECLPMLSRFSFVGDISCSLNSLTRFLKSRPVNVDIQYNNRDWLGQQNPNAVQSFYRDVEEVSGKGVRFNLEWNSHQSRFQGIDDDDN